MRFREATVDDKEQITEIMTKDTNEDGPPGYNDGSLAERFLSDSQVTTYMIVVDETEIGFMSFSVKGITGVLEKFCVLPVYIGRGFGF
ncbi:hypothetical protein [Enterococcus sp. LJL51]|uniref:hypothetical protein n=1 Tax=Enterococcus sp. LJL51 TaxID=3416656 RepID=UPI003CEBB666